MPHYFIVPKANVPVLIRPGGTLKYGYVYLRMRKIKKRNCLSLMPSFCVHKYSCSCTYMHNIIGTACELNTKLTSQPQGGTANQMRLACGIWAVSLGSGFLSDCQLNFHTLYLLDRSELPVYRLIQFALYLKEFIIIMVTFKFPCTMWPHILA